jgi:hypothetical protein
VNAAVPPLRTPDWPKCSSSNVRCLEFVNEANADSYQCLACGLLWRVSKPSLVFSANRREG